MIDYARMKKIHPRQKGRLTLAVNSKDPLKVKEACRAAIREWNEIGCWPDDWTRWQRALDDVLPWGSRIDITDWIEMA